MKTILTALAFLAFVLLSTVDLNASTITTNNRPDPRCNVITATWGVQVSPDDPNRLEIIWVQGFWWEKNNPVPNPFDSREDGFVDPRGAFVRIVDVNFENRWFADGVIFCPRPGVDGFPPLDCIRLNSNKSPFDEDVARLRQIHPYLYEVEPVNLGPISWVQVVDMDTDPATGALQQAIIRTQVCAWNICFEPIDALQNGEFKPDY